MNSFGFESTSFRAASSAVLLDSTVSEDAGIEPRTLSKRLHWQSQSDALATRLNLIIIIALIVKAIGSALCRGGDQRRRQEEEVQCVLPGGDLLA